MIDNCTAELYCAGQCVGNTLWNCTQNIPIIVVVAVLALAVLWALWRDEKHD